MQGEFWPDTGPTSDDGTTCGPFSLTHTTTSAESARPGGARLPAITADSIGGEWM
jgi:hypothetical protein